MERFSDRFPASEAFAPPKTTPEATRSIHQNPQHVASSPKTRRGGEIEPQPIIEADDRRMAVRALRLWERLRQGRELPWIADFDAVGHPDFSGNAILIVLPGDHEHAGASRPAIAHLGERLKSESKIWQTPRYMEDLPPSTIAACLGAQFTAVTTQGIPQQFSGEYVDRRSLSVLYRGMFLPFAASAERALRGKADCVYGVVNWRYALDAATSAALVEEVRAALDGLGA